VQHIILYIILSGGNHIVQYIWWADNKFLDKICGQINGGKILPLPGSGGQIAELTQLWRWGNPTMVWGKVDHLRKTSSEPKLTNFQEKTSWLKSSIPAPRLALQVEESGDCSHTSSCRTTLENPLIKTN
jgi:hypothetical protein